jgi:hypothetical protein
MKSLSQAVANRGWTVRPISISSVAQRLSLGRPVSLKVLIAKCLEPVPQIVRVPLSRTTGFPEFTHAGSSSGSGNKKIKTVRNLEQFSWYFYHDRGDPPIHDGEKIEAGEVKTTPWAGMYVDGIYWGHYVGEPKPGTLTVEIEVQT